MSSNEHSSVQMERAEGLVRRIAAGWRSAEARAVLANYTDDAEVVYNGERICAGGEVATWVLGRLSRRPPKPVDLRIVLRAVTWPWVCVEYVVLDDGRPLRGGVEVYLVDADYRIRSQRIFSIAPLPDDTPLARES